MTEEFDLLKVGTEVITEDGYTAKIAEGYIYRPTASYLEDAWEYVLAKNPAGDYSQGDVIDFDDRFVEVVSDPWLFTNNVFGDYIVLDLSKMSEDQIKWDEDYICVDVSEKASYERELHDKLYPLSDIELPRDIHELDKDELEDLYNNITAGSLYVSDYENQYYVDSYEVCNQYERFEDYQADKYGEDKYEEYMNAKEFAYFIQYVA